MEEFGMVSKSTGVKVRIYDLFNRIDALWVCGCRMKRTRTEFIHYYEFVTDTMLPLTIHVANSCKSPLVSAIVETGSCSEVRLRGNEWGESTPDVPFNMVEFIFRVQENAVGTIGVSVAVRENKDNTKYTC